MRLLSLNSYERFIMAPALIWMEFQWIIPERFAYWSIAPLSHGYLSPATERAPPNRFACHTECAYGILIQIASGISFLFCLIFFFIRHSLIVCLLKGNILASGLWQSLWTKPKLAPKILLVMNYLRHVEMEARTCYCDTGRHFVIHTKSQAGVGAGVDIRFV